MAAEAKIRAKLESLVQVKPRYKTLYYGLRRNHPHMAAVTHPLIFLLRRIIYAAIVLFMVHLPLVGTYLLCSICVAVVAFVILEQQWEDLLIAR